ncbi:hypothetical protein [Bacillus glycinifermentans]
MIAFGMLIAVLFKKEK